MYELELFAGAGGGILAQGLLGHITVGAIEIEPYCRAVAQSYGAQKNSLLCRMLRELDLYPTASLCELLMGWPDRWSRLEPLATDKFLRWRRSHGDSSQAA